MKDKRHRIITIVSTVLFAALWVLLMTTYQPMSIVTLLGVEGTYLAVILLAILGSITSMTTFTIYPAIGTFVVGGANPLLVPLVAATGMTLGGCLFFWFGTSLRELVHADRYRATSWMLDQINDHKRLAPVIIFIYVGFTPLPNAVLLGTLSISGWPFKKTVVPLILGNLVLTAAISFAAYHGTVFF